MSEPSRQSGQNPLGVVAKSNRKVKEPQVATLGMPVTFVSTKMICCPWGLVLYFLLHFFYIFINEQRGTSNKLIMRKEKM